MNKKTVDSNTNSSNNDVNPSVIKSSPSLSDKTKMLILPPKILQNICLSDSMRKDESIVSALELMKKDSKISISPGKSTDSTVITKPSTTVETNKNNATEVPKVNTNERKLISKANQIKQVNKKVHTNIKKRNSKTNIGNLINSSGDQESVEKIKYSTQNEENNQTTLNNVPKSQREDMRPEQSSSQKYLNRNINKNVKGKNSPETDGNLLDRSKRIRRRSIKEDTKIQEKQSESTPNKESKQLLSTSLLNTPRENDSNTSISITPALTKNSLPLASNHVSGGHSTIKNGERNFNANDLQNTEDVMDNKNLELKNSEHIERNNKGGNEILKGSINTSIVERTTIQENDLQSCTKLETTENLNTSTIQTSENRINSVTQSDNNERLSNTPVVKRRGRPKRIASMLQETVDISNESEGDSMASENVNHVSIAETVLHNKRHSENSYNISNNVGLGDDSSTGNNIPPMLIVRKRGRPPGTSAGKVSSRGRGKGRSRGRGRGKRSSDSTLDTDYVPKLKGSTSIENATEEDTNEISNAIAHIPREDLVTCTKCEADLLKKQWDMHNLLKHNNMSWIKGDEPLDFENNMKLWKRILTAAHAKKKGKLSCEKCGSVKRSVNGFISHMQFCGKSEEEKKALMATCPICNATMMPSSMKIHERTHRQSEQSKVKIRTQLNTPDNDKLKRRAAEKAVSKILEFTDKCKDPPEKKAKVDFSLLKNVIKPPAREKGIPSVLKGKWKKQLASQEKVNCHQPGCTYTSTSYEEMTKHFTSCSFIPEECYMCKICKFSTTSNEEMVKHVTEEHSTAEGIDKNFDLEEESCSSDESVYTTKMLPDKEQVHKVRWSEPYFPALQWSLGFEKKNYELSLFSDYSPNPFILLNNTDSLKYLPELEISMRTKKESTSEKSNNTEISWKQWKRFEGDLDEGTPTFFTGGPVWALAWLPIPSPMYSKNPCQYIAVSTHPTMESEYTVGKSYSEHNMIQIWNVGPLDHEPGAKTEPPTLSYAIAHNSGTIWCLEWCPSGCYEDESLNNYKRENETKSSLRRMGMLAAACSDGNVHIYSLPFSEELKFTKTVDNKWPIYCTDPVITLVGNISMYDSNDQNWQCTKLSWTKERGHNTIAAGFSNGYIGIWDLTYKSPISMQKRENTYFINSCQYFYGHGNAVSMIALIPYNGEKFLASGSLDRTYKVWNLEDTSVPQSSMQKGIITDGAWMMHWPMAAISLDDALGYKHTNSYLVPLRELEFKYFPILATNSATYTLAVSDYANGISHGTLAGEVLVIFVHELVNGRDYSSLNKKRKLSSFVKVVDFLEKEGDSKNNKKQKKNSKDYHYMPDNYEQCRDRFGLIFCDNLKDSERFARHKSIPADKLTAVSIEEYPFMSVNRISWNPNSWSYLWMAVGYQNGLIRLLGFKYMSLLQELQSLLPEHAKHMLNKSKISAANSC